MDEMYLKMILALSDEFFEGWEWKHCDYGINLDNIEKGRVIPLEEMFHTEFKILYVDSFFKDIEWILKDRVRPIPSQEQLQKMLESKMLTTGGNRWHVFCTFDEFVRSEYERRSFWKTGTLITDSFEMLWLACVMKEKYGKTWDGEKWM